MRKTYIQGFSCTGQTLLFVTYLVVDGSYLAIYVHIVQFLSNFSKRILTIIDYSLKIRMKTYFTAYKIQIVIARLFGRVV